MNLKLKRLVRTTSSEQYALFDLDQVDVDEQPMTIGKLDMHYTTEGVYGTILLWDDDSRQLAPKQRKDFVRALLDEISQPMGVPNEFVVEFFAPTLDDYEVFHNLGTNEGEEDAFGASDAVDADLYNTSVDSAAVEPVQDEDELFEAGTVETGATDARNGGGQ